MTLFRGLAAQIEEAIGREATTALLGRWGGCQISLPVKAEGSALAGVIGVDAATQLIAFVPYQVRVIAALRALLQETAP